MFSMWAHSAKLRFKISDSIIKKPFHIHTAYFLKCLLKKILPITAPHNFYLTPLLDSRLSPLIGVSKHHSITHLICHAAVTHQISLHALLKPTSATIGKISHHKICINVCFFHMQLLLLVWMCVPVCCRACVCVWMCLKQKVRLIWLMSKA